MPMYRVERTELHTRVYLIDAPDEQTALAEYFEHDDELEDLSYHSGHPDVVIKVEP